MTLELTVGIMIHQGAAEAAVIMQLRLVGAILTHL